MAQSFWNIPNVQNVRTPLLIMKEQAALLGQVSNGLLSGQVYSTGGGNRLVAQMIINVPKLNGYSYVFLLYENEVTSIYPGELKSLLHQKTMMIHNEDDFNNALQYFLQSDEMKQLIGSLLAQAGSA